MITIVVKGDDVRTGKKAKSRHGRLREARELLGQISGCVTTPGTTILTFRTKKKSES